MLAGQAPVYLPAMISLNDKQRAAVPPIRLWLWAMASLVFAMVIVGGATRLTDSGLSITEWQPLLGAIPPLTEADWLAAFAKYKLIPEYAAVNAGMSLADFKFIYWWEWSHRFLGRFIGVVFLLPFLYFWASGRIPARLWPRLAMLFILGGLQGALGWYMVASGIVDRVDVSQYRLAAHLTLATVIFGAILWISFRPSEEHRVPASGPAWTGVLLVALILLQIAAGGFVAGLNAGMGYTTWPLMDGKLIPDGLFVMAPAWRNLFENAMTVQFDHRMIAYAIAVIALLHALTARAASAWLLAATIAGQILLGISTLLGQVPLSLALMHQAGAMIVFAAALWNLDGLLRPSPVPDPR
ncbi:COX15/CtaA family protein [soil metagenome]